DVTVAGTAHRRLVTFLTTSSATRILMITGDGGRILNTETCGSRARRSPAGRHIGTGSGDGFRRGVGPGLTTSLGALRHFTMGAGLLSAEPGDGCQVRRDLRSSRPPMFDLCTPQRSLHGLVVPALLLVLASVQRPSAWPGFHWARATCT